MARQITAGGGKYVSTTNSGAQISGRGAGSAFSVLLWFRCPDNGSGSGYAVLCQEVSTTDWSFTVQMNTNGALTFNYRPGGVSQPWAFIGPVGVYDDDKWHVLFAVSRATNDYEMYVDWTSVGTSTTNCQETNTMQSAMLCGVNQLPVNSCVARFMTFRVGLSLGEARALAYGRIVRLPHMWWELGVGSPEPDWGGQGFGGTVAGSFATGPGAPVGPLGWWGAEPRFVGGPPPAFFFTEPWRRRFATVLVR